MVSAVAVRDDGWRQPLPPAAWRGALSARSFTADAAGATGFTDSLSGRAVRCCFLRRRSRVERPCVCQPRVTMPSQPLCCRYQCLRTDRTGYLPEEQPATALPGGGTLVGALRRITRPFSAQLGLRELQEPSSDRPSWAFASPCSWDSCHPYINRLLLVRDHVHYTTFRTICHQGRCRSCRHRRYPARQQRRRRPPPCPGPLPCLHLPRPG